MNPVRLLPFTALLLLITAGALCAQIPQMISYQGRVASGGVNFHGTGQFKFALVRGDYGGNAGETFALWTHDGTGGTVDPNVVPAGSVSVNCDRGLYSVLLGNTAAGMVAIPPAAFGWADIRLRVWFNDGTHGFQLLTPDQRLVSVGYAMIAGSAQTVPDGSINSLKLANNAVTSAKITDGAITSAKLAGGAVTAQELQNGAVRSAQILDGSIAGADLANGAVTGAKIAASTITGQEIANGAITAAKIVSGTITGQEIANGAVTAAKIAANTITGQEIANGTITAAKIAGSTITSQEIANATITAAKIAGNTITGQEIANGTITAAEIAGNTITNQEIANATITAAKIAGNTITGQEMANRTITSAKMALNTITSQEIAVGGISTAALADNAVSTAKVQNASVTYDKLALNAVHTGEILDGEVRTADLGAAAVTGPKLAAAAVCIDKLAVVPSVRLKVSDSTYIPQVPGDTRGFLVVPWDVEEFDTQNIHDPANPSRLTAPVRGIYRLSVCCSFLESFAMDNSLQVRKNQVPLVGDALSASWVAFTHGSGIGTLNVSADIQMEAGDYLVVAVKTSRTSGGFGNNWVSQYLSGVSLTFVSNLP